MAARHQARAALGRDPNRGDLFEAPTKARTHWQAPKPIEPRPDPYNVVVYTLAPGEAAERLGVSRAQVGAGKVETVGGLTKFIPMRLSG